MKIETVTIAIPVLNGGELLRQAFDAIDAQRNASGVSVEVLIVDSGSTDGSAELAEQRGARVIRIAKKDFSHGGTRNMAVGEAKGEVVALLTHDSTPAHDGWLDAIVDGFSQADDVALVYGPHLPREEHSHTVKRELADFFETFAGESGEPVVQRGRDAPTFYSDVNGALAKWAWEKVPYQEVPYSEDQLLGREMIEAGFAKVYAPGMAVIHSHDYTAFDSFKRYFDEYRGLRETIDYKAPLGIRSSFYTIVGLTRQDRRYLRENGASERQLVLPSLHSLRHYTLRLLGEALGGRADRLPDWLTRRISLEGRAGFRPSADSSVDA
jgi:glycosyltransferase involved in cell wall biosynthesis